MHRFFVAPDTIRETLVQLRGPIAHQIRDVLRLRPGDEIVLLDNSESAYRVGLVRVERDVVRGRVEEKWKLETEPRARVTLYQAMLKGQKFDWVLQKGTELGIGAFVPVLSARCIVSRADNVSDSRLDRWQRILVEAAEQSARARLPNLSDVMMFKAAWENASRGGLSIIPWEEERSTGLREALQEIPKSKEINVFIGPEGGFTEEEISIAKGFGINSISLGPRILRAETAGIVAAAAIFYELGDLG